MSEQKKVYLLGQTNVGKTTLFNTLTGMSKKVANYHGATTTLAHANIKNIKDTLIYDLPGTYSLTGDTRDEQLTVETLKYSNENTLWLFVIDAMELKKGVLNIKSLLEKFSELNCRAVVAVNMMDEADYNKVKIFENEFKNLNTKLEFVFISAKTHKNIDKLLEAVKNTFTEKIQPASMFADDLKSLANKNLVSPKSLNNSIKRVESIDKILLSPFFGPIFFILTMTFLFQAVFTWATPFMDLIESAILNLGASASKIFESAIAESFIQDALFGGMGAFLVFTPQILILSFLIKVLEESGYLSRASLICHRLLQKFGLSGESFIPILTSHACAIPGIYATRTITSNKVRILTLLSLPLTVCSARLPVYALLITITVPSTTVLGGAFGLRGLYLFALYIFGIFMTLLVSSFLSRYGLQSVKNDSSRLIELTRYKVPDFKKSFKEALNTCYHFIKDAGLIIFLTNTFIWLLATLPNGPSQLKNSYLSAIGKSVNFIFKPLGMDWPETVAILTSFLARETFVSTLGTLYNVDSDEILPLAELIKKTATEHSTASSVGLIVFFAIALQCVSTVALLRTELPKKAWALYLLIFYFLLAYAMSFIAYNLVKILSF